MKLHIFQIPPQFGKLGKLDYNHRVSMPWCGIDDALVSFSLEHLEDGRLSTNNYSLATYLKLVSNLKVDWWHYYKYHINKDYPLIFYDEADEVLPF